MVLLAMSQSTVVHEQVLHQQAFELFETVALSQFRSFEGNGFDTYFNVTLDIR